MVVACIALLVALSGTGYAVTQLSRNEVAAKHIRTGAVGTSEVKNRSLLRKDFKRGQLRRGAPGAPGPAGPPGPATAAAIGPASIGPDQLATVPAARARHVAGSMYITLAAQELPMTDDYDSGSIHPEGESVFIAPRDGIYLASAYFEWTSNATGRRALALIHDFGDDTDVVAEDTRPAVNGDTTAQHISEVLHLAPGDEIHVAVQQNSGGSLSGLNGSASLTYLGRTP
jgi:hypothetical protein